MGFIKTLILGNMEYTFFLMIVYILVFSAFTRIGIRDKSSLMIYSASVVSYMLYLILSIFTIIYYVDSWILHTCLTTFMVVGGIFLILLGIKTKKDIEEFINRKPTDPDHYDDRDYHPERKDQFD